MDLPITDTATHTTDTPQVLLEHHFKELRLPTILREYDRVARQCAVEQVDYPRYLLRITELQLLDRERRATDRRIRQAKFPVVKSLDSFHFLAIPSLNKNMVLDLARSEFLMYIALFSRFTTCGSWEGHNILDYFVENDSDVPPDTIHADTQGQSAAIFGLAHLLGIQLQPRIRNWKGLHFYRSRADLGYDHIDGLFSKTIDWPLIETMLPEMLRVAVSIRSGRIKPSTILRRLATYSRKSKLFFAFRELGNAVRTGFLLDFLSDVELRRLIQAATNKSERFNQFLQWVAFGGGALATEGIRDEQRKFIKYNHLVANLLIFHNVVTMSKALERLQAEGYALDTDLVARFSPYATGHLNRFGRYDLNKDRVPEPLDSIRAFRMPPRGENNSQSAQVAVSQPATLPEMSVTIQHESLPWVIKSNLLLLSWPLKPLLKKQSPTLRRGF